MCEPEFIDCRMTNALGQSMDIYENPSEHYAAHAGSQMVDRSVQSTLEHRHLKTMQPSTEPRYYMEAGPNGPKLRMGLCKCVKKKGKEDSPYCTFGLCSGL